VVPPQPAERIVTSSARDAILHAIRAARPPAVAAPGARQPVPRDAAWGGSLAAEFSHTATAAGADVRACSRGQVDGAVRELTAGLPNVWSHVAGGAGTPPPTGDPRWTASLDLYACEATLGVAENGALWIATDDPHRRAALFLASRVLIVVEEAALVPDLHEAYARLDVRAHTFGVFVAGPSKTADIEQSLVIGAHGPKELTVIMVSPGEAVT
jgi:L-lactate dehydrogenase complex protein LldG